MRRSLNDFGIAKRPGWVCSSCGRRNRRVRTMKRYCLAAALCLAVVLAFSGCRSSRVPAASSSPTPKEVSSSDQVVKAYAHFIPTAAPPASLELVISPGFHVNANPATFPYLIATEVQAGQADG